MAVNVETILRIIAKYEGAQQISRAKRDIQSLNKEARQGGGLPAPDLKNVLRESIQESVQLRRAETRARMMASQRGRLARQAGGVLGGLGRGVGTAAGGAGQAGGFFGRTVGGLFGAVGGGLGQGGSILAGGGGMGAAAGVAAAAIPVALVAVGGAAAAALGGMGLGQLFKTEASRLGMAQSLGPGGALQAQGAADFFGGRFKIPQSKAFRATGTIAQAAGRADETVMGQVFAMQTAYGIGVQPMANLMAQTAQKGGDASKILQNVVATGMTVGVEKGLARGRMGELVRVFTSIAQAQGPGAGKFDALATQTFLRGAGRADEQFKGIGGLFAAQQFKGFTRSGLGMAIGMSAAGLGQKPGVGFFEALESAQKGPFTKGGVGAKSFMEAFGNITGLQGGFLDKGNEEQRNMMSLIFSRQQGIDLAQARGILTAAAGGKPEEAAALMEQARGKTMDDAVEIVEKGFKQFEALNTEWEQVLSSIGGKLVPALEEFTSAVGKFKDWADALPEFSFEKVGRILRLEPWDKEDKPRFSSKAYQKAAEDYFQSLSER